MHISGKTMSSTSCAFASSTKWRTRSRLYGLSPAKCWNCTVATRMSRMGISSAGPDPGAGQEQRPKSRVAREHGQRGLAAQVQLEMEIARHGVACEPLQGAVHVAEGGVRLGRVLGDMQGDSGVRRRERIDDPLRGAS